MSVTKNRDKISENVEKIFDTFREGVCITDSDGTILYLNNKYEELANLKRKEILGQPVEKVCRTGIFDMVVNPEVVRTKKPVTGVQSVSTGPHLFLDGYPVFDSQGDVSLVVSFIRDMNAVQTLKKLLMSQEKQLAAFQFLHVSDKKEYPTRFELGGLESSVKRLRLVADTDAAVLLLGETGVGKDVFAKELHELSARSTGPFVKADCSCIPEHLMESELFGYEPGAFSGASKRGKKGFFEEAASGTLFLDEIGELPLSQQAKLLRVLQDRQIVRLGSALPREVDVRIIAATNKDLEHEVESGRFRSDLFFRLNVAEITIPPLRDRREDIMPLVEAFLKYYTHEYRRTISLAPEVRDALVCYDWPGNVREVENIMISLVVTCEKETAELRDLPFRISSAYQENIQKLALPTINLEGKSLPEIMDVLEKLVISDALKRFGSIHAAAKQLNVDRTTIFRKCKKHSL